MKFKRKTPFTPVLEAARREAVRLIVRIAIDSGIAGIQVPSPGIRTRLRGRPKVDVRTAIIEITVVVAVAGQKSLAL